MNARRIFNKEIIDRITFILVFLGIIFLFFFLYKQLKEHFEPCDPKLCEIKKKFEEFFNQDRYWESPLDSLNNKNIMKHISLHRGNKSYTIDKKSIYICMKNEKGEYYDDNMLIFVLAHEISHAICDEIGHTEKFHRIFQALLIKLTEAGIYDPNIPIIQEYCEKGDPEV